MDEFRRRLLRLGYGDDAPVWPREPVLGRIGSIVAFHTLQLTTSPHAMTTSTWALQQAVYAALTADAALLALLGGARIYDDVPQGSAFPYVTFGPATARDWSTGSESGDEHVLTVHAWSRAGGRKEAQALIGAVREALHDAPLTLDGHRLVNLRYESSETRREPDGDTYRGIVRFRAVTEPGSSE